ncbi:Protein MAIN-LIKE 2 [Linum perenne]
MTHTCRNSKKIVDNDPRFESILSDIGLDSLRDALKLTPDPELITALVERWRLETNTFHLYGGEATITLEDVHFITGLSADGLPVTSPRLIPSDVDELCAYVESQLGKKLAPSDVLSGRIKMTWLRSHFAYREGAISDDDIQTICNIPTFSDKILPALGPAFTDLFLGVGGIRTHDLLLSRSIPYHYAPKRVMSVKVELFHIAHGSPPCFVDVGFA